MNLYDITQSYNNLIELLDNDEVSKDVLNDAINSVNEEFEQKAENIAKLIKNFEADVKAFKDEENRIAERRRVTENRIANLKDYLDGAMKASGKTKFKHGTFSFSITKNAPSVDVIDESEIPEKWYVKKDPVLNKKGLLEALKAGTEIKGVKLVQKESLRIR